MKPIQKRYFLASLIVMLAACSTGSNLKKFEDGDLSKELSQDVAKRFEVKDIPVAPATPAPTEKSKPKPETKKAKHKGAATSIKEPPVRKREPMPFAVGEKLSYDIRYVGVTAGTMQVEVLPERAVDNRRVYQLRALVKTLPFFNLVYRVNDTIESFMDSEGIYSHRFTMDLDETKQTRKLIELYDYQKNKSYFWNRIDHSEKGLSEQKETYDIQPWSQDPISSLYFLRVAALPTQPGVIFKFPVVLDGKPWESRVHYVRNENIYAGGKNRDANVYHLENYENGELKNKENTIWISNDANRYILRIEAKVKIGSFAVALDKVQ